ncbi:hypothetical protein Tco_0590476 [Tanacetum coccineum]
MSKVLQERGFGSLPSSTETNPKDHVKSISATVEADMTPTRRIGSSQYKGSYGLKCLDTYSYRATCVNNSLPQKDKDPGSFTLPCYINNVCFKNAFTGLGSSISVMPLSTYLNLSLGELAHTKLTVELTDRTVKHPERIAENVLVGIIVENMDSYRDQDMRDAIFGEPLCKASCMEARRFDGLITIHNGLSIRRILVFGYDDLAGKEIDKVGKVSIIWNPMCVVVMLASRRIDNTHSSS